VAHQSLAGSQASSTFIIRGLVTNAESVSCLSIPAKPESTFSQDPPENSCIHLSFRSPAVKDFEAESGWHGNELTRRAAPQASPDHEAPYPGTTTREPPPCPILSRTMT